jgi:O-antigen ligase
MKPLFLLVVAICTALPSGYVAAALPALWIVQGLLLPSDGALLSAGPVDIMPMDLLLLALLGKAAFSVVSRREMVADKPLYIAIAAFLVVNFLATLAAGVKFDEGHSLRCFSALARFASEIAIVPILAQAVSTVPQARRCVGILLATLAALAVIQFINFFGASHGIVIGEVQGIERGELRYFGPVGDSVGAVLLLGYVAALCFANMTAAGVFLGGILLTAGIGAILGAGVATGLFLVFGSHTDVVRAYVRRNLWLFPLAGLAVMAGAFIFARPMVGTLVDRLTSGHYADSGGQRMASATVAVRMIEDNPLLGVGFMGYQPALQRYGGAEFFDLDHPDGSTANANNQLLQALTDGGIVGFIAFGALIFCIGRLFLRTARQCGDPFLATFYLAAFIWLLAQLFGNVAACWLIPSSYIARLLWILVGTAVAVARLVPETEAEGETIAQPTPAWLEQTRPAN